MEDLFHAAPLMHMPVNDILAKLNLPPLPQLPPMPPLPHMPSFPTIDPSMLLKPLTDLLSGFGTGNTASLPFDPTKLFDGLMQAFQSVVSLSGQAMSTLAPLWTGPAAQSAMLSGAQASANGARTGEQSGDISTIVATATATVGKGVALLQGVIADFVATLMPMLSIAWTPVGQGLILGSASAHLSAGMAIVGETRAELTAHTAHMASAGVPVNVTAVPQVAAQLPGLAATSVQTVAAPIKSMMGAMGSSGSGASHRSELGERSQHELADSRGAHTLAAHSGGTGGGAGAGGVGGMAAIGGLGGGGSSGSGSSAPMAPRAPGETFPSQGLGRAGAARAAATEAEETVVSRGAAGPTAMPIGGAGLAGAAGASNTHQSDRETSVDARHMDEVVGDVPDAAPSVLGDGSERELETENPDSTSVFEDSWGGRFNELKPDDK